MRKQHAQIGVKVRLKESYLKRWVLTDCNYDIHHCGFSKEAESFSYNTMIQLSLMQLIGVPVVGTITRIGNVDCVGVQFNCYGLKDFQYYDLKDLVLE